MSKKLQGQVQEVQRLTQELSRFRDANASLTADCAEEKTQRLALAERVASLQLQLDERGQTVADMQERVETGNEGQGASLQQPLPCGAEQQSSEQLSSAMTGVDQQVAPPVTQASVPVPVIDPAHTPAEPETAPWQHAPLVEECNTIIAEFTHVPALRDAIQQRDELQRKLRALAASENFRSVVSVGKGLQAVMAVVAQQPLSEKDYLTLTDRFEALVQKVTVVCRDLTVAEDYDSLDTLATKLEELRVLEASALPETSGHRPQSGPATAVVEMGTAVVAPDAPTAIVVAVEERELERANEPVQTPAPPAEVDEDEEWAHDPVYVPFLPDIIQGAAIA
jgi:hypothetical protein